LQFDNAGPISGDVEIDLEPSGWHPHGHDANPRFKNVILHVVWDGTFPTRTQPNQPPARLVLKNILDTPADELALALQNESGLPVALRGKCSAPLRELARPQLAELLHA